MDWNAFTGMLIGICTPNAPPDVSTPSEILAMTLESGCDVPIWDVELYDSSYFPAAAGTPVQVADFSVCVAWHWMVAVAVPPRMSATYVLAML